MRRRRTTREWVDDDDDDDDERLDLMSWAWIWLSSEMVLHCFMREVGGRGREIADISTEFAFFFEFFFFF